MEKTNGKLRVVIEGVKPEIDGGRFPVKRAIGEEVVVEADIFADSHDVLSALLLYRREGDKEWREVPMTSLVNDLWRGAFTVTELGQYRYTIKAWVDPFASWCQGLKKKVDAKQEVGLDLLTGAELVESAGKRAEKADAVALLGWADKLKTREVPEATRVGLVLSEPVAQLMAKYVDRSTATLYAKELAVLVDRPKARFSAWYEMFPRSYSAIPGQHGTFKDCETHLPYIADMGFDVLYFPPIHPIGKTCRKGKNNALEVGPDDPGSPWGIGSDGGGHKAVHPQLGTLADFRQLVARARELGLEVALDLALHCSCDHPYVKEHPEWFRRRPDGSIQYAENPPKKYQDTYPLNFEGENWRELWEELKSIVLFWIEQGVRIFRVDNPHTKPFRFWEWLIGEVRAQHPDVVFLSEAFTRPKIMHYLAKLGFNQSYTYFTWRNTKWELVQYFTELTQTQEREYFRPNLWPNTPDILHEYLQTGGRPAFMARLVLAATLGANYGIYGPAFELGVNIPREKGSEEYLNSEKYEIKYWNLESPGNLKNFIARVNRIRRENPALQHNWSLRFHNLGNDQLIAYSKSTASFDNIILVVVNLDPQWTQSGWVELPLSEFGLSAEVPYIAHDLLHDAQYEWRGPRNYVELGTTKVAHIIRLQPQTI
ncbi:MAG: alpha-1,4-glucan--maltose-1-phosphate maltosyltransferase [Chloroflexi bacterium]|nr:alpha-1,4-glucan--maltose-1-phosphate maltosyltransferase [Chloroflexota bacterium]